jgi:hypothetical protein
MVGDGCMRVSRVKGLTRTGVQQMGRMPGVD